MKLYNLYITICFACIWNLSIAQSDHQFFNKNIGLCGHYSDTLTFDEINCGEITIFSDKKILVTSYILSYYQANQMNLELSYGFGNTISKEDIEKIMKIRPKKIFIQEALGESDTEILILGNRTFFLK
jgi:hypothetical protein